ncbi:hypothetical protein N1851_002504 [Merluccius polli]|uniref:USP domain-containing protein n=1 Tax=Merluccius polli TaxID=89951 RepID=A0AA47PB02_MERPO|nr:hypothetical protein N1851_002504 [Merluccius polli]
MKRYHHDGVRLRKVSDAVSIPPLLSLGSFVGEQGDAAGLDILSSGDREREHQDVSVKDHSNQTTYHLSGIVSHFRESIDTGHYISDIVGENGTGWLTLNDNVNG